MPGHSLFSLLTVQIVKLSQAIYLVSLVSGNWGGGVWERPVVVSYTITAQCRICIHLFVPPMFT